jgi:hypothetical protein
MSVRSEINRIETAKAAIGTAIAGKGVAVPSGTKLDGMAALIDGIEQGGGGEDVSAETAEYTSLLTDLETAIDALPDAGSGGGGGAVETCTVSAPSGLNIRGVHFSDGTNIIKNDITLSSINSAINVAKNSFVFVMYTSSSYATACEVTGEAEIIIRTGTNILVGVNGDCSIVTDSGPA